MDMIRCRSRAKMPSAGETPIPLLCIRPRATCWVLIFLGMLWGCGAKRPVLYPNHQLTMVGQEAAAADIDQCMELAQTYGADTQAGTAVAKDTATGAAVGGATGAAVGGRAGRCRQGGCRRCGRRGGRRSDPWRHPVGGSGSHLSPFRGKMPSRQGV